jgi:spore maturation protein CgeB
MKKVLIIGPEYYDYYLSVEKAFKNLGYSTRAISYFNSQVSSLSERIRYHFSKKKEHFFDAKRNKFNETVLGIYAEFEPDLVFIIQALEVHLETVKKMNKSKKILWMMDSIFRDERCYALRNSVDEIFVFEKTDIPRLWEQDKVRAHFLPLALDETIYFPTVKTNDIDILFVGALYENRIKLLEKVCARFKGYNIRIYGYYYSPFRRPLYHLFRKHRKYFLNKNISPEKVNQLYNRSRICLNIHHAQNKHGVNQRFFEISGSKAFQLVDHNEYITQNFSEEEIMTYRSVEEMIEKIEMVFKNKINTALFAEKAYNKVMANHTFTHRIKQMLDFIQPVESLTGTSV